MGYSIGMHAPGRALLFEALPAAHHLLLAHGRAAIALRESVRGRIPSIGCANNHAPMWPASDSRRRRRRDQAVRRPLERAVHGADAARPLPGGLPPAGGGRDHRGRPDHDPPAARLLRRQLLQPDAGGGDRRGIRDALRVPPGARLPGHRLRLARRTRGAAGVADHDPRQVPRRAAAADDHRVRLLLQHGARRERRRRRPAPHRLPRSRTSRPSPPRSTAASTSAATTPGRSSTTSSGPRATPSASASSTSTSRPRSAPPSAPSTGTASSSPPRPSASTELARRSRRVTPKWSSRGPLDNHWRSLDEK